MKTKNKIIIGLTLATLMMFICVSYAGATVSPEQNLNASILESGLTGTVHNCSPLTVTNGTVAAYPTCTITCDSGYHLSGSSCIHSGGGGGGGGSSADTIPPTNTSISINAGAATTSLLSVTLTLGATGATQMTISNNASFSGASWETYITSKSWTLTSGDGLKTVYAKFRDSSENISTAVSDTITVLGNGTVTGPLTSNATEGCSLGNLYSTTTGQLCANNNQIPGCDNRTTGFSITTGNSCIGNTGTGGAIINPPTTTGGIVYNFGTVTLKNGSTGEAVKELQRFLNRALNLGLVVDGKLGPKTIAVIKQWQKNNGLVADGLVGPKTKALMNEIAKGF